MECWEHVSTPFGDFLIKATDKGITSLSSKVDSVNGDYPSQWTASAAQQLKAYFEGELQTFEVNIDYRGFSTFQRQIMELLQQIPFGKTISYTDLALRYGDLKSIRAVANANARNPLPIIVPCHRVIGKNGHLTGYALGIEMKKALLTHENPLLFSAQQRLAL